MRDMIKRLSGQNVKVPSFNHECGPVTVFTGPNFSGKTARLDAIRLALYGELPELGGTARKAFQVSCDGTMAVELNFESGRKIERSWRRTKGGQIRTEQSGLEGFQVPAVMLNPSDYFELSEREKVRYIARIAASDSEEWTGERIVKAVADLTGEPFESETGRKFLAGLAKELDESDTERHEAGEAVQDWLETRIEWAAERVKDQNATADRLKKFVHGQVQLRSNDQGEPTASVDSEIAKVGDAIAGLKSEIKSINDARAEYESRKNLIAQLSEAAKVDADAGRESEETRLKLADLQKKVDGYQSQFAELSGHAQQAAVRWKESQGVLAGLLDRKSRVEKAIAGELKLACVCCGNTGRACAAAAKRIAGHESDLETIHADSKAALEKAAEQETAYNALKQKCDESKDADVAIQKTRTAIRGLQSRLDELAGLVSKASNARAKLEGIGELKEPNATTEALAQELREMETEMADLRTQQKRHAAYQQEESRLLQAQDELTEAEGALKVAKAVAGKLRELQAEMVQQVMDGLLARANELAGAILSSPLAYHDGEIGRWRDAQWITHKTFSGTEKLVAYLAISMVLAADSPVRILVVDELGRLTKHNRTRLVEAFLSLIGAGTIDQVFMVDLDGDAYEDLYTVTVIPVA
jgi:DNA repair exonuclease SbcCD ATPase subunit